MSDGGGGCLHQLFGKQAPAVSVLIFVTQKPNDNFSLALLLTFMQKKMIFSLKFRVVEEGGAINPPFNF